MYDFLNFDWYALASYFLADGKLLASGVDAKRVYNEAKKKYPHLFVAAFKAEYAVTEKELIAKASAKLSGEDLDLICANDIGRNKFGSDVNKLILIDKKGVRKQLKKEKKKYLVSNWTFCY